ncbi:hypothetical protein ABTC50_20475, partial [Acinetobacter baumannii]
YYGITEELNHEELYSNKWKTYLYLRTCVLEYRENNKDPLLSLIRFLEADQKNKEWFAKKLLDPSEKAEDEKWGSGQHEWLERCLIIDVLKR